jgi:hypothetical protein
MSGNGSRRKDRHPHLRLVHSVEDPDGVADEIRDEDIPEVIEQVMRNLARDAHAVTHCAMVSISQEFHRHGLPLRMEEISVVRDTVFETVAEAFRKRLLRSMRPRDGLLRGLAGESESEP